MRLRAARADELAQLVAIDDDASTLYSEAGTPLVLAADHPFAQAEASRWAAAIAHGRAQVAVNAAHRPIGFATLALVDGEPYLDQLSVRREAMRRGVGTALLEHAIAWSAERRLWLTTYAHLPWNRPFYERHGFVAVADRDCGRELLALLEQQRAVLPDPDQRIAMVRVPADAAPH